MTFQGPLCSPARACCVTREGPGAGVSLLMFNIVIRSQESSEIQNGATQGQPRLLVLRHVVLREVCCFLSGSSGRTEGVGSSTIKMYILFKSSWNFCCSSIWKRSFWENVLNLLSPAVCRVSSAVTQHGNCLSFYFHAAAVGEACFPCSIKPRPTLRWCTCV